MSKYLFKTKSGIENYFVGNKSEWISGDIIPVKECKLTVRKNLSDYITIGITDELEYIGSIINIHKNNKYPIKIFKILNSEKRIYIKPLPYSNGFYVGHIVEDDFNKFIFDNIKDGNLFIMNETDFYSLSFDLN